MRIDFIPLVDYEGKSIRQHPLLDPRELIRVGWSMFSTHFGAKKQLFYFFLIRAEEKIYKLITYGTCVTCHAARFVFFFFVYSTYSTYHTYMRSLSPGGWGGVALYARLRPWRERSGRSLRFCSARIQPPGNQDTRSTMLTSRIKPTCQTRCEDFRA